MNFEDKMQIVALASSVGPDTDRAAILQQLAKMATADQLESIAAGGCDMQTRQTLYAAASMARTTGDNITGGR